MLRSLATFGLMTGLLAAPPAPAPPAAAADPLIARMQQKLSGLRALQGRFTQSLDSRSLGRPREERGRFFLRKPLLMRWEYEEPEKKLALVDGTHTWLYLPEDREVHRGSAGTMEKSGAAARMLVGRLRLDQDFASRRLTPEEVRQIGGSGSAGGVVFELIPRQATEEFERLLVAIDPDSLALRRLSAIDALGGRMTFEFFDLVENPDLPGSLFRFEPPPGVDVLAVE